MFAGEEHIHFMIFFFVRCIFVDDVDDDDGCGGGIFTIDQQSIFLINSS